MKAAKVPTKRVVTMTYVVAQDLITRAAKQYKENTTTKLTTTRKERNTNKLITTKTTQKQHNLLTIH